MSDPRLDAMRQMAAKLPGDARVRFFLAHELFKAQAWDEAAGHYAAYLELDSGDVGAAWKNLGICHERSGRREQAADAFRKGIDSARSHHHDGLAAEIEDLLDDLS